MNSLYLMVSYWIASDISNRMSSKDLGKKCNFSSSPVHKSSYKSEFVYFKLNLILYEPNSFTVFEKVGTKAQESSPLNQRTPWSEFNGLNVNPFSL